MFTTGGRKPTRYQMQLDGGHDFTVIAGTLQLTDSSANVQIVDGGAAIREIRMPASNRDDVPFRVVNAGATSAIQLRTSTGANVDGHASSSATSQLAVGETATCVSINGTWGHMGVSAITL